MLHVMWESWEPHLRSRPRLNMRFRAKFFKSNHAYLCFFMMYDLLHVVSLSFHATCCIERLEPHL